MVTEQDILRYLEGRASTSEADQVKTWLEQNEANLRQFESIISLWSSASTIKDYQTVDVDGEWNSFSKLISQEEQNESNHTTLSIVKKPSRSKLFPYSIAASLALLIGTFFFIKNQNTLPSQPELVEVSEVLEVTTQAESEFITLSDASTVVLEVNSSLEYSSTLATDSIRQVNLLTGSAVFDVTHDPEKKFVVIYDGIGIEVLGTKFYIGKTSEGVNIKLKSGSIKAYQLAKEDNNIIMVPGDDFTFKSNKFVDQNKSTTEVKTIKAIKISKPKSPIKKAIPAIKKEELKGSVFRIGDVLNFLDIKYGKQLKIDKKLGVDKNDEIRIDINQGNLILILQDLEKTTSLQTKPGKCQDCYIITAGNKK